MCFLHKFHFEMLYVLEWPKNRNWLALEFPAYSFIKEEGGRQPKGQSLPQIVAVCAVGAGLAPALPSSSLGAFSPCHNLRCLKVRMVPAVNSGRPTESQCS